MHLEMFSMFLIITWVIRYEIITLTKRQSDCMKQNFRIMRVWKKSNINSLPDWDWETRKEVWVGSYKWFFCYRYQMFKDFSSQYQIESRPVNIYTRNTTKNETQVFQIEGTQ